MFLAMGITGKVGGATAEHLLAHGKEVRALVRNREKAARAFCRSVETTDSHPTSGGRRLFRHFGYSRPH